MKFKRFIVLGVIFVFGIFALLGISDIVNDKSFQTELSTSNENIVALSEQKKEHSTQKSMLESMRENGEPEIVIENAIARMKRWGHNIDDWVVVED